MSNDSLEANRFYSAEDIEEYLGRKLAEECAPLATVRGRYWGATVIHYLNEIGKQRVAELMEHKTPVDSPPGRKQRTKHEPQASGRNRRSFYQDPEP